MADTSGLPDVSKANFYDQPPEEQQKLLDALKMGQDALQKRYENPNWFNVAAGFFKPQLGGFAASLGSASQALGDWTEKQRANEIPIAEMRARVGMMQNQMTQNRTAAQLAKEALSNPGGLTAESVAKVANYDKERGAVLQQQFANQETLRRDVLAARAAGASTAELVATYGEGVLKLLPAGTPDIPQVPGAKAPSPATGGPSTSADNPPPEFNIPKEVWMQQPLSQRNSLIESLATANKNVALDSMGAYRSAAEKAQPKLALYMGMRELAADPKMAPVFNILGGSDIVSLAGKAISEGRLTERLAGIEDNMRQAYLDDPTLRSKVARLAKLINETKSTTNTTSSPTDQATALRGAANPSMDNPQTAFLALTDALAHTEKNHLDIYDILQGIDPETKSKYNAATFMDRPSFKNNKTTFMKEHADILKNPPGQETPSWYLPTRQAAPAAAPRAAATAPISSYAALKAEMARRAALAAGEQ